MVRSLNLELSARTIDTVITDGSGRSSLDMTVVTPVATAALYIGLDRLLYSTSPVDRLLHSADPLARFRAGAVPADPSPIATRGMTVRVGDIHAEIATRHDIGGMRTPDAALRGDTVLRGDDNMLAAHVHGPRSARDVAETAALPQRLDGASGTTPGERGIAATFAGTNLLAPLGTTPGTSRAVSFDGLVDILDRPAARIVSARDAPVGAVLVYERTGGGTVAELRTATGFAGLTDSTLPLTGIATGRSGEGFTLVAVFVRPQGEIGPLPFPIAAAATAAGAITVLSPLATGGVAAATRVGGESIATPAQPAVERPGLDAPPVAAPQQSPDAPRTRSDAFPAGFVPPPPDGSELPAGQPAASEDSRQSFGEGPTGTDASDRPYIHSIWYDILALRFEEAGVSLVDRSTALRDVVWATALEHGPFAAADGSDVLSRVAALVELARAGDATIVEALFAERARVGSDGSLVHYPDTQPFDRDRVIARLGDEAAQAGARVIAG